MKTCLYICLSVLAFSCKTSKTISEGEANLNLSTKQLIKENTKQKPNFKTLAARVKIDIVEKNKEKSYTVNIRLQKDEKILLLSTPISVVKALITPEKFSFYNKLDNTYFEGDYSYLSDLLGTELDFQKIQNLLLGEALYNLRDDSYKMYVDNQTYVLQPKKQRELFELFLLLESTYFKVKSQQISQSSTSRHLQIDYLSHQDVDKQILPERIKIIAVEENEEMQIHLEYKGVSLNEALRFPFKIPSDYKEIEL
ncbi:DUF4292 domain-containing protein [Changchengzhania lutea]|uniref:DUF4292 domain-containing protein n=1 Tax=Changchengzhania lutea TaxID=2049305 RepID=UPI00115CC5A2|nr:DUF4292 domain-containing protein [Changchengzhania lutea]